MIEWWNKNISSCFPIPSSELDINTKLNLNFGLNKHNDIYNTNYFFNNSVSNDLVFNDLKTINVNDEEKKIDIDFNKQLQKINDSDKFDDKQKNIKIKTLITKKNKSIKNIDCVTKSLKIYIYPTNEQIIILNKWFNECVKIYDFCIDKYNNNKSYFKKMDRSDKIKIFNDLYRKNDKNTPYDI